jgi:predicted GTPase
MADDANGGAGSLEQLEGSVRRLATGARVVHAVFRPSPLEPISGRRVFCMNTVLTVAGDGDFDELAVETVATAEERFGGP